MIPWVLVALCLAAGLISCEEQSPRFVHLTILHTNDMHGHLLPFSYPDPVNEMHPVAQMSEIRDIGGLARVATLVQRIRAERDREVLFLDAGDILDGTPFSVYWRGLADVEAMTVAGYEAMVAGNHEFNLTFEGFREMVAAAGFPILCANARLIADGSAVLPHRRMFEKGGLRIGVFGITTLSSQRYPACRERIEILDPAETAREQVAALRAEGADLIVALTHLGYSGDVELAESVEGIDVIIGGHSHTRRSEPKIVRREGSEEDGGAATLICHAYQWAGELGRLDLTLERGEGETYRIASYKSEMAPVTNKIPEDEEVASVIRRYFEPMRPIYDVVIGEATADFANIGFERATINLVADVMRERTGVDVALQNYGGVRESIFEGPVRVWEIASMLPFDNRIVTMELAGDRLIEALQSDRESFGFSGMRAAWKDDELYSCEVDGSDVQPERIYTVATNDYIHDKIFSDIPAIATMEQPLRETVIEYIKEKGTIEPVLDGRIRLVKD
jgi:2',3'-cyclic-nucleotide 2'-phosphodiesterase (5'-nucleotidase family)